MKTLGRNVLPKGTVGGVVLSRRYGSRLPVVANCRFGGVGNHVNFITRDQLSVRRVGRASVINSRGGQRGAVQLIARDSCRCVICLGRSCTGTRCCGSTLLITVVCGLRRIGSDDVIECL